MKPKTAVAMTASPASTADAPLMRQHSALLLGLGWNGCEIPRGGDLDGGDQR